MYASYPWSRRSLASCTYCLQEWSLEQGYTSLIYIFDAYSQDTHDSYHPFNHMCVHAFQSNYPLKGLHTFRGSKSKSCVSQSLHYIHAYPYLKLWLYVVINYQKGGIESTMCFLGGFDNSWQHTLSLGLILLSSAFQIKSTERVGKKIVEIPQDARKWVGKASSKRTLNFTLWEITLSP